MNINTVVHIVASVCAIFTMSSDVNSTDSQCYGDDSLCDKERRIEDGESTDVSEAETVAMLSDEEGFGSDDEGLEWAAENRNVLHQGDERNFKSDADDDCGIRRGVNCAGIALTGMGLTESDGNQRRSSPREKCAPLLRSCTSDFLDVAQQGGSSSTERCGNIGNREPRRAVDVSPTMSTAGLAGCADAKQARRSEAAHVVPLRQTQRR